jgi:hypothetical protein
VNIVRPEDARGGCASLHTLGPGSLGAEQKVCYLVDYGLGELKVFSQVVANVLLSMLGFLDDAISNAFRDLRRVEALQHKIEEGGPQRSPPLGTENQVGFHFIRTSIPSDLLHAEGKKWHLGAIH